MEYLCITCCKINKNNKKSFPFRCPKTDMICFALKPQYVTPKVDAGLMAYIVTHQNPSEPIPRIEIDSEFIDAEFVAINCMNFDKLAKDGDKGVYCAEAY